MEDLYTYIKNDSEINMDDYFANVFDAISIDGKLPYITNGVSISTMLANSSALGESGGWTLDSLEKVLETSGLNSISNLSSTSFLEIMLQTNDSLVDWASGECFFNSPEFIELLELAGKIQESSQSGFGADLSAAVASYEAVYSAYQIAQYRDSYKGKRKCNTACQAPMENTMRSSQK